VSLAIDDRGAAQGGQVAKALTALMQVVGEVLALGLGSHRVDDACRLFKILAAIKPACSEVFHSQALIRIG